MVPERLVLRAGRSDAAGVPTTWCIRRAAIPFVWLGVIGAAVSGRANDLEGIDLTGVDEVVSILSSPLAGFALAILLRVAANWFGLMIAYPLARTAEKDTRRAEGRRLPTTTLRDRLLLTRALRDLRWTTHVRRTAAERLGRTGRRLQALAVVLSAANPVLFVAAIVSIAVTVE